MALDREQFYTIDNKRMILIVDDEQINREILGFLLRNDYNLIYAVNGREALEKIRENRKNLSMVLMDFIMPELTGLDALKIINADEELKKIPVIMFTADAFTEAEALSSGAVDFISKPFPHPDIIRLRIKVNIELSEGRRIISSTETDALTGLYNRDFFYRYVSEFNKFNPDVKMDALIIDIDHFHLINERFGREYGDRLLCELADMIKEKTDKIGGIACRRVSDTFLVYLKSGADYSKFISSLQKKLDSKDYHVFLRMGVYPNVDKNDDVSGQFTYAKLAADSIRGNFSKAVAVYDNKLKKAELFNEQLVEDFSTAVSEGQFEVYYQPKFNIQGREPFLYSAEALVRWIHPEYDFISPGDFIPLFEENGLISQLDCYVWDAVAAQIAAWKKKYGISIPVSVNVSRIDMLSPGFLDAVRNIISVYGIEPEELILEITESAYVKDTDYVIQATRKLRKMGFRIAMDDFGTGYSSLAMISDLPIDALKIDRSFVNDAIQNEKSRKMLRMVMDISDCLNTITIAEGVENRKQLDLLKSQGCEIIQGFYFSKPVRKEEFEKFIKERAAQLQEESDDSLNRSMIASHMNSDHKSIYHNLSKGLSVFYDSVYYVDMETDNFIEYTTDNGTDHLRVLQVNENFFEYCMIKTRGYVAEDDLNKAMKLWDKKYVVRVLKKQNYISEDYRVVYGDKVNQINVRIMPVTEGNGKYLVVTMSGIGEKILNIIRNELDREKEKSMLSDTDSVTGAFSRLAFIDKGNDLSAHPCKDYAIAYFTVKGLNKDRRNDELKKVYEAIASVFESCDIYRIGADEFVTFIEGKQLKKKDEMLKKFCRRYAHMGDLVIECTMAEKKKGDSVHDVMEKAHELQNKNRKRKK